MPAPPFLVGLSAGASAAVIARVIAQSSSSASSNNSQNRKGQQGAKQQRRPSMLVRPKPFQRVPESEFPKDPCVECGGSGRTECPACRGRGRTNMIDQAMLPKAVWPEWCTHCRGSGRINCSRCAGLGKYRQKLGFNMDDDEDD